jgi:hypothetical protein
MTSRICIKSHLLSFEYRVKTNCDQRTKHFDGCDLSKTQRVQWNKTYSTIALARVQWNVFHCTLGKWNFLTFGKWNFLFNIT